MEGKNGNQKNQRQENWSINSNSSNSGWTITPNDYAGTG